MTENSDELYCIGCSAKIQTVDPQEPVFMPQSALE